MWPRGGQKEKEETESENRPYTLNTHSEAEGGEGLYKHKCCWLGGCKFDFGKGIQSFKGGKTQSLKTQTFCSLPAALALKQISSKK